LQSGVESRAALFFSRVRERPPRLSFDELAVGDVELDLQTIAVQLRQARDFQEGVGKLQIVGWEHAVRGQTCEDRSSH
jgi:hypothetical protein